MDHSLRETMLGVLPGTRSGMRQLLAILRDSEAIPDSLRARLIKALAQAHRITVSAVEADIAGVVKVILADRRLIQRMMRLMSEEGQS